MYVYVCINVLIYIRAKVLLTKCRSFICYILYFICMYQLTNVVEQQKEQRGQDNVSTNMLAVTRLERPAAEGRENVEDEIQKNTILSSDYAILHPYANIHNFLILNSLHNIRILSTIKIRNILQVTIRHI